MRQLAEAYGLPNPVQQFIFFSMAWLNKLQISAPQRVMKVLGAKRKTVKLFQLPVPLEVFAREILATLAEFFSQRHRVTQT